MVLVVHCCCDMYAAGHRGAAAGGCVGHALVGRVLMIVCACSVLACMHVMLRMAVHARQAHYSFNLAQIRQAMQHAVEERLLSLLSPLTRACACRSRSAQAKWRAVEEHLLSEAPPAAPFRTALLRLRLSDETQVGRFATASCRRWQASFGGWKGAGCGSVMKHRGGEHARVTKRPAVVLLCPSCNDWPPVPPTAPTPRLHVSPALQVATALEQVAAVSGEDVTLGSYPVRCDGP